MLKLESTSKTPGELVKTQIPGPHPQILHSVRVEWDHGSAFLTGFQPRLTLLVILGGVLFLTSPLQNLGHYESPRDPFKMQIQIQQGLKILHFANLPDNADAAGLRIAL